MSGWSCWLLWVSSLVCLSVAEAQDEPTFCLREVAGFLHHPTHVASLSDGSLLVSEQRGRILQLNGTSGRHLVLEIFDRIVTTDSPMEERGLLSFAVDMPDNLYVCYCGRALDPKTNDHDLVVAKFPLYYDSKHWLRANSSGERRLLAIGQPGPTRNGGFLFFGSPVDHRLLYVTVGSGGWPNEDQIRFDSSSFLGKVLRLDVSGSDPSVPYTIPLDNPFFSPTQTGAKQEIYALGFWNPWRCSVDQQEERIFCGDVGAGPNNTDLVVILVSGGIYGCTSDCQAKFSFTSNSRFQMGPQRAIYTHKHEQGQALIGGPLYRGSALPELSGAYLFGDFVHGSLHALREETAGQWTKTDIELVKNVPKDFYILSITTDSQGEPLLTVATELKSSSSTGSIYSLQECSGAMQRASGSTAAVLIAILFFHLLVRDGRTRY